MKIAVFFVYLDMVIKHIDSKKKAWVFNLPSAYGEAQAKVFGDWLTSLKTIGKTDSFIFPENMKDNAKLRDDLESITLAAIAAKYR